MVAVGNVMFSTEPVNVSIVQLQNNLGDEIKLTFNLIQECHRFLLPLQLQLFFLAQHSQFFTCNLCQSIFELLLSYANEKQKVNGSYLA